MKRGRQRDIHCQGEMIGRGSWNLPDGALIVFGRYMDDGEDDDQPLPADHPVMRLRAAWAAYQADVDALGKRPSRDDELRDLAGIRDAIARFRDQMTMLNALDLRQRLDCFPPISRGTFSTEPWELVAMEEALRLARDLLPWANQWHNLPEPLGFIYGACGRADPPTTGKPRLVPRDRLIRALEAIYTSDPDADTKMRRQFPRDMLTAFGVPVPNHLKTRSSAGCRNFEEVFPGGHQREE